MTTSKQYMCDVQSTPHYVISDGTAVAPLSFQATLDGNGNIVPVSSTTPMPISASTPAIKTSNPFDMSTSGQIFAVDLTPYPMAMVNVTGLTGVIYVKSDKDNTFANAQPAPVMNNGAIYLPVTVITASGQFYVNGGCWVEFVSLGGGSGSVTINVQPMNVAIDATKAVTAWGSNGVGSASNGSPVEVAGVAKTAMPTAQSDGNIQRHLIDKIGRQVMRLGQIRDLCGAPAQTSISNTTETTIIAADATYYNDLQGLFVAVSATYTGAPTFAFLDIRSTTGGTVLLTIALPNPTSGVPTNTFLDFSGHELNQASTNTNWTAQLRLVGGTTPAFSTGGIYVTPLYVKNS